MEVLIVFPLLLAGTMLWAFLRFQPAAGTASQRKIFDTIILGAGAILAFLWYMNMSVYLQELGLPKYIPLLGIGGAAGAVFVYLALFFLLRNFYVFKGRNYGPGRF